MGLDRWLGVVGRALSSNGIPSLALKWGGRAGDAGMSIARGLALSRRCTSAGGVVLMVLVRNSSNSRCVAIRSLSKMASSRSRSSWIEAAIFGFFRGLHPSCSAVDFDLQRGKDAKYDAVAVSPATILLANFLLTIIQFTGRWLPCFRSLVIRWHAQEHQRAKGRESA